MTAAPTTNAPALPTGLTDFLSVDLPTAPSDAAQMLYDIDGHRYALVPGSDLPEVVRRLYQLARTAGSTDSVSSTSASMPGQVYDCIRTMLLAWASATKTSFTETQAFTSAIVLSIAALHFDIFQELPLKFINSSVEAARA